jgi:hypothetical protein
MAKVMALMVCFVLLCCFSLNFVNITIAGNDDADQKEVGVEWVENYSSDPLKWTSEAAEGFYSRLGEIGWTKRFDFGDDLAWESDFEKSAVGGSDYLYIDTVDFAWFGGHGDSAEFMFSTNHDGDGAYPCVVHYTEASWGDLDLEWVVISACQVLQWQAPLGNVFDRWAWPVFKGLHAIFGFDSNASDQPIWTDPFHLTWESPGKRFVDYMAVPYTIGESWQRTTIDWQPSDNWGAALAVCDTATNFYQWDDYLPGYGYVSPDVDSPTSFVWRNWQC